MNKLSGHCGSVRCAGARPCKCECQACNALRLRAANGELAKAEAQAKADWLRREKEQARIDEGRDIINEYNSERGGR